MSPEDAFRRVLAARLPAGPGWTAWIDGTVAELAASGAAIDAERHRVYNDPGLTADAEVYEVMSPDPLNPEWPVRYRLDVTGGAPTLLSVEQPGPLIGGDYEDMFIDLDTLEQLGQIAAALRKRVAS